jgi:glycerol uptake facilitator-like aquaporin
VVRLPLHQRSRGEVTSLQARRAAAEALGTFFLVLIGPGSAMANAYAGGAVGHVGASLAFAFVVIAMIYASAISQARTSTPRLP